MEWGFAEYGVIFSMGTGFVALVVWAIRLEGMVKNNKEKIVDNEQRDRETRSDVRKNSEKINSLETTVTSNQKIVEGIEKEIKSELNSINGKLDILLNNK